jgi:alpha-L-fucosidase 2
VHLLAALPRAFATGRVSGLCARGGFVVDMAWKDGKLAEAAILSRVGGPCRVRYGDKVVTLETEAGQKIVLDGSLARK